MKALRNPEMEVLVPRNYQTSAVKAAWNAHKAEAGCALTVMATGLGKTLTAGWFTRKWCRTQSGRVAFLVDKIEPAKQAREKFDEIFRGEFETGIKCSEVTDNVDARVLFSTFDSMSGMITRGKIDPNDFTLVIVDESHHAPADTYVTVIKAFVNAFWYAITATPDRMDGRDIRELFGEPVYSYPLEKALAEDKWLANVIYKVRHANVDVVALRTLIKRVRGGDRTVSMTQINRSIFLESEIEQVAEDVLEHQDNMTRTIVFCSTIEHCLQVHEYFVDAEIYVSGLDFEKEQSPLDRFRRGDIRTIIVVDKLNEAIDVPEADLVVFWRSTLSKRIWLQQLGRGLRRTRRKQSVTVLDYVANCERVLMMVELAKGIEDFIDNVPPTRDFVFVIRKIFEMTFTEELVEILKVLERVNVTFYETYGEARAAVQKLNPTPVNYSEYRSGYRQDPRLPSDPNTFYKGKGWMGWRNFLGTGWYMTYKEAQSAVQSLDPVPASYKEYNATYKQDSRLPSNPNSTYEGKGWIGVADFLGKRRIGDFYPTYKEAKAAVQKLNPVPVNYNEYKLEYRQDPRLPCNPNNIYKDEGWIGVADFLGKRRIGDFYPTYKEAETAVQKLNLVPPDSGEYRSGYRQDPRLPSDPNTFYKGKGWMGWRNFLGTGWYMTYKEAQSAVQSLDPVPASYKEYNATYKQDSRLPSNPNSTYEGKGWIGVADFLGKRRIGDFYPTYKEAKAAVQKLNPVPTRKEGYALVYRSDLRLPASPPYTYGDGWVNWGDFLETRKDYYPTYEEAKNAVQKLNPVPSGQKKFRLVVHQDPRIPRTPAWVYADRGWVNWYDFLGKGQPIELYGTYEEAKASLQRLNPVPRTSMEYKKVRKQDLRLPLEPFVRYDGSGWVDWSTFLGTNPYSTYSLAKVAVQRLNPVPTTTIGYERERHQDSRLPSHPQRVYRESGWVDWYDFLGKPRPKKKSHEQ